MVAAEVVEWLVFVAHRASSRLVVENPGTETYTFAG
jgi:hypothetical protein